MNLAKDELIEFILFVSISYNFFLAIINSHFVKINAVTLSVVEVLLIFSSFVIMTFKIEINKFFWIIVGLGLINCIDLLRIILGIQLNLKFFRDVLIQFAFIGLGVSYKGSIKRFQKFIIVVSVIISAISFCEIFYTPYYENLVNPKDYYITTKKFNESDFWNEKSKLFVSATRPNERFISKYSKLPRASAIFLEPVTLGNFIILFVTLLISFQNNISQKTFWLAIFNALFLIFASDSRLTIFTVFFLIFFYLITIFLKKDLSVWILLVAIIGPILFFQLTKEYHYQDNIVGRVNYSIGVISNLSVESLLGFDQTMKNSYWDSGIAYLIVANSLFYLFFNLFFYIFILKSNNLEVKIFRNISFVAIILSLIVSNSFFSIKTASLWWFSFGICWKLNQKENIEKNYHLCS